ncbi:MAG TPA: neuraminidase-like domain-containing protein [Anaerolineales bacterium]
MVTTVVALGTAYVSPSASGNAVQVIPALKVSDVMLEKYPSMRSLFGDLDYCECAHCQSVLGPAAYLADLMHFLQRSPLTANPGGSLSDANYYDHQMNSYLEYAAGGTVLGALLQRRPDLADLELSCENTDTEIPYIDLVLEILENAVALPLVVDPAAFAGIDIDAEFSAGNVPAKVAEALRKTDIQVGKVLHVTPDDHLGANSPLRNWIITDGSRRWLLQHQKQQFILFTNDIGVLQVLDVADAARSLKLGKLNAELEDKLAQGVPISGAPVIQEVVPMARPLVQFWTASYTRAVAIKITMGNPMGAVALLKLDGTQLRTYQWPMGTVQVIAHAFTSGVTTKINPNVATLLALPANETYLQTWNPAQNWWELSIENTALFADLLEGCYVSGLTYQNSSVHEHLESSPENRNPAAYDILAQNDTVFPWALPFDLWLEETRAFLEALGITRASLIDLARPQSRLSEEAATLELLGLSKSDADLIAPATVSTEPWIYWGLAEKNNTAQDHTAGFEWNGNWLEVLAHLSMLLQQSGLSYREYLDLLQTRFVGQPKLILFPPNECQTSKIFIAGLNATEFTDHLNRIHVFTRLWRKSGWNMRELDLALAAFGGQPTPIILQNLALLKRLQAGSGLPVSILVACIDKLETQAWTDHTKDGSPLKPALYDSVFQRKSLRSLSGFDDFAIEKLANPSFSISDRPDFIAASLGIKLGQVKAWISGTPNLGIADLANLDSLSRLYAAASLCRALRIAPEALPDIVTLLLGAAAGPFRTLPAPTTPDEIVKQTRGRESALVELVECIGFVRESGFDFETLSYLLQHRVLAGAASDAGTRIELQLTQTLTELRTALQAGNVLGDVSADNLKRQLAHLGWYPPLIDEAIGPEGLAYQPDASVEINPPPALTPAPLIPLNLSSKFTYQNGSPLYSVGDLKDFAGLVGKFSSATANALSAYLWNRIPTASRTQVQDPTLGIDQRSSILVDALNTIVQSANIHVDTGYSGISLDTQTLAAQNLTGPDLVLLNGILLAEAYPLEIARNQAVLKCAGSLDPSDFTSIDALFPAGRVAALETQYNQQLQARAEALASLLQVIELEELPQLDEVISGVTVLPVIPGELVDRLKFEMSSATAGKLRLTGWLTVSEMQALSDANPANPALSAALNNLQTRALNEIPAPSQTTLADAERMLREPDGAERCRAILLRLVPHLELDLVTAQLSTALGSDPQVVGRLLDAAKVNARSAKVLLTDSEFLRSAANSLVDRKTWPDQFAVLELLGKIATLANRLTVRPEQLDWLLGGVFTVLDVLALPTGVTTAATAAANFDGWRKLVDLFHLRDVMPDGPKHLAHVYEALKAHKHHYEALVRAVFARAFALGPHLADGVCDAGLLNFDITAPALNDYNNPTRLLELAQLLQVSKLLGTPCDEIERLIQPGPGQSVAQLARTLFAASIDANAFPERLRPISDRLRNLQRDALVAYLIHRDHLADSNELFDRYLIDVEMGPCMLTSRIKQAISSVQLFVQRCLLNLERSTKAGEPGVSPDCIDTQRWQWTKFYRVWEANRKIFLYPENWIEPELRDDKTEIFQAFESDLLQSEITHDTALMAFRKYLDKLADVVNLTVVSMFEEKTDGGGSIVHLVGRDSSQPYKHYYRQWKLPKGADFGTWTAWEEISVQLDSEHVLVFLFDGSVYLAWPSISGQGSDQTWQVRMNLCKRTASGWSKLKKGRGEIVHPMVPNKDERTGFVFRLAFDGPQSTLIRCYGISKPEGQVGEKLRNETFTLGELNPSGPPFNVWIYPDIRTLARFTDTSGKVFLYLVNDIACKYEIEFTYQNWNNFNGAPAGPEISKTVEFSLPNAAFRTTIPLRDNIKSVWFETDQSGHRNYYLNRIVSVTIKASASSAKYVNPAFSSNRPLDKNDATWVVDIVFDLQPGQFPDTYSEAALSFTHLNSFKLTDDDGFELFSETIPASAIPKALPNTEHFMSGYREVNVVGGSGALAILPTPQSLAPTPAQYFVAQAASNQPYPYSPEVYAYHDDRFSLLFWRAKDEDGKPEDNYRVVPFSTGGMRKIMSAVTNDRLLDAMKLPLPGGPPTAPGGPLTLTPVPLGVTGFGQQNSVDTIKIDFEKVPGSIYNWEVFFHNPLLVATQLSQAQRFEEAQRWFHLIFDPTTNDPAPESIRYWRFLPFREAGQGDSIDKLLQGLAQGKDAAPPKFTLKGAINEWAENPFRPHLVARHRLRSYQFAVVQKYVENLVAWGDQLFRRDTIESINEATQLYVLAAKILGKRPVSSPRQDTTPKSYRDIYRKLDDFSNAWIPLEPLIVTQSSGGQMRTNDDRHLPGTDLLNSIGSLYFCIPGNEKLAEYWDTVDDRLFKIRHCMNIEGIERQLPLFEPPIDPALLVRATAAGLDLGAVLSGLDAPLPLYRFNVMLQKALELCGEVRALGNALLSALEKKDAEQLSLLRSSHEIQMLKLVRAIKEQQQKEAEANLEALRKTREVTAQRYLNYQRLMGKQNIEVPAEGTDAALESSTLQLTPPSAGGTDTEGLALISAEAGHMGWLNDANNFSLIAGSHSVLASVLHVIPNFAVGITWPVTANTTFGGSNLGSALGAAGAAWGMLATNASFQAGSSATIGGYQRRYDEWQFQSNTAAKELDQIDKQILANEIRIKIAESEIANHDQQMENTQEVDEFMRDKFTNQQLYSWMVGQISSVYFRTYQLAHDIAKRVERTYRFELGLKDSDSSFIEFGYWDSLKKGLLSGERLYLDLKRMEGAYLDKNKREYEITKHVSLMQIDPMALLLLKETGQCDMSLPEALLDMDFPGHYLRRIKSVSLTIPCVTGPYSSVPCTLTLLKHSVRHSSSASGDYGRDIENDDPRFIDSFGAIQSIVTSSAQNDSGMFETNLRDERYLPFEGAGVISTWHLELPRQFKSFDYDTISDVILHVRYTAREGGGLLRNGAVTNLTSQVAAAQAAGSVRLFSVRHEFPTEWAKFQGQTPGANRFELALNLRPEHYPFWSQGRLDKVERVDILARSTKDSIPASLDVFDQVNDQPAAAKKDTLAKDPARGNLLVGRFASAATGMVLPAKPVGELKLFFADKEIGDLWIAVTWSGTSS